MGEQLAGAVQMRRRHHRCRPAAGSGGCGVGTDGEDAFDGSVGRVAHFQRPGARHVEPVGTVAIDQAQDALGGTQVMQRPASKQPGDQFADVLTGCLGSGAAPDRGAHEERDLLRWVVRVISAPAPLCPRPGLDQLTSGEDLGRAGR